MGVSVSRDSVIDCRPREGKVVGVKQVINITYRASNCVPATADLTYTCVHSDDERNLLPGEHFGGVS